MENDKKSLWIVTGDEYKPVNLRPMKNLGDFKIRTDGVIESNVIWWIGWAKDGEDAVFKAKENIKLNPYYKKVLEEN